MINLWVLQECAHLFYFANLALIAARDDLNYVAKLHVKLVPDSQAVLGLIIVLPLLPWALTLCRSGSLARLFKVWQDSKAAAPVNKNGG